MGCIELNLPSVHGTDVDREPETYRVTFRLLETDDEHFCPAYLNKYHGPVHAWVLPDAVLKKIYRENALKLLMTAATPW